MKPTLFALLLWPLIAAAAPDDGFHSGPVVEWPFAAGGNGHFYQAVDVLGGVTWDDANGYARLRGGHLANAASMEENQFVFALIDDPKYWMSNSVRNLGPWLGGHRQPAPGPVKADQNWVWTNGQPFTYTNWSLTQPDNSGYEDRLHYLSYSPTGRTPTWNDISNGFRLPGLVIEFDAAPPPLPAGGWSYLQPDEAKDWPRSVGGNDHRYQAVEAPIGVNWADAQAWATAHGGYLATLNSPGENGFVLNLIKDPRFWSAGSHPTGPPNYSDLDNGPWLGGFRLKNSGKTTEGWFWLHHGGPFTFTSWSGGPNQVNGRSNRLIFNNWSPDHRQSENILISKWGVMDGVEHLHSFVVEYGDDPPLPPPESPTWVPLFIASLVVFAVLAAGLAMFYLSRDQNGDDDENKNSPETSYAP